MKRATDLVLTIAFFSITFLSLSAQHSYTISKKATVNVASIEEDFFPQIMYHGEVKDGQTIREQGHLESVKQEVTEKYPRHLGQPVKNQLRTPGPQIINGFEGITGSLGIPLDNHLAVNDNGDVITVANFHFVTYDKEGTLTKAISLIQMTRDLGLPDLRYDPRVIYDREADRFVLTMLHSSAADQTKIIVGFSEDSDPTGDWHFYVIEGNPFGINIFSDYPMLGLTNDHFYFTVNAVDVDKTWQEGFVETYIWEMDKNAGYDGGNIDATMYNEILFEGKPIRNLCPVTPSVSDWADKQYFLSNRNFAVENDTLFLVSLENGQYDVRIVHTDIPYGVPPNAIQNSSLKLQTNDARVLDAYSHNGQIQFVGNCVNPNNGLATIYHGIIADIDNSDTAVFNVLNYGDLELGYPDISYAGLTPDDDASLIVTSHVGEGRFPGISALEYTAPGYSDLTTLHEGTGYISQIGGEVQRWGDYAGNQRRYNKGGHAWTVASFGRSNREYGVYIAEIVRFGIMVSNRDQFEVPHSVFPVPADAWLEVQFDISKVAPIRIYVVDQLGQVVSEIVTFNPKKLGPATFRMATDDLAVGSYVLIAETGSSRLFSEQVVIK